jgi:hypothetical protein
MNINQAFPRKYAVGQDIDGKQPTLAIRAVTLEQMGEDGEKKPVIWFTGAKKGVVLNKTMARAIANIYGPETDGWIGKYVTLYSEFVRAFGENHCAIRVKAPRPDLIPGYVAPENHRPVGTVTIVGLHNMAEVVEKIRAEKAERKGGAQ